MHRITHRARPRLIDLVDKLRLRILIVLVLSAGAASPAVLAQCTVPCTLVWADEFDGSAVDPTKWEAQLGTGPPFPGWGNVELQYYRAENATVADGHLTITAKREAFDGAIYTSARLRTRGLADFTYGRFEMRAKLPYTSDTPEGALTTKGLWPAFWLLHSSTNPYGIWAASGEIDIMEWIGREPDEIYGTIHYGGTSPNNRQSGSKISIADSKAEFHEYAIEWDENEIRWYLDGVLYAVKEANQWFSGGFGTDPLNDPPAPFDIPFHIILNLAVGGNWPRPPDANTIFPAEFVVDYVRVYELPPAGEPEIKYVVEDNNDGDWSEFDCSQQGPPTPLGCFDFRSTDYRDQAKKWKAWSNRATLSNTTDVPPADGGSYALRFEAVSPSNSFFGGARIFGLPLDIRPYETFSLWVDPEPGESYNLQIVLQDDDDGDASFDLGADDEFIYDCPVSPAGPCLTAGGGWQLLTIPLADFVDGNNGGNGALDTVPVGDGGNGVLFMTAIRAYGDAPGTATLNTDYWVFRGRIRAGR